ncbi:MAG TPA: tetratricopeptide repeat protein [Anaerolineae bacterium]|nr:tetratricopeptide repeat protein [Anaerolineae bacterium]
MDDKVVLSDTSTVNQSGGVDIAADTVHVAGDVVGRDKITNVYQVLPTLEIKPPPEPSRPPDTAHFVGRQTELSDLVAQLTTFHLAIITGMAGMGKTTLAAVLAKQVSAPSKLFWHVFHTGEDINVVIWKLAGFLAWHEQPEVWRMLQGAQTTGGQLPPPAVLFDYVFQTLRGQNYLLGFDDFHLVESDPLLEQFAERLQKATRAGELSAIIASRHVPDVIDGLSDNGRNVLAGLRVEDAQHLIIERGVALPDDLITAVYAHTQGNAQLLILAIDALRRAKNPANVIARLVESEDIERYLMTQVDGQLTAEERQVISAVAVLLGYPGTRQVIAAVLDGKNVRRTVSDLTQRNLLTVTESDSGREYSIHAIVRAFYYDSLAKRERQGMHDRAGHYYETDEPDAFRAALHFEAAGQFDRAAVLIIAQVEALIDQGKAHMVHALLERLADQVTDSTLNTKMYEARGDLHYLLGELDEAVDEYEAALQKTSEGLVTVRLLRKASEVLARQGEPERALENLTHGTELLKQVAGQNDEAGPLAVVYGTVMLNLGHYAEAVTATQLALAQPVNPAVAANLHDVLGKVHFFKGELASSLEQFQIALDLRRSTPGQKSLLKSYSNLAVVYGHQKRYADALQANQIALEIAEHVGDIVALGMLYNNMAADAANQGYYDQAIEFHNRSLALHERMGDLQGLALAHRNLGDVYRQLGNFELTTNHVLQSIDIARQASDEGTIIASIIALAEVCFTQNRLEEALSHCQESLDRAEAIQNAFWRPVSLQLMGRIYQSMRRWPEARTSFNEACQIWRDREAWIDLSNTLLSRAKMERDVGQLAQARELCAQAATLAKDSQADDLLAQAMTLQSELTAQSSG